MGAKELGLTPHAVADPHAQRFLVGHNDAPGLVSGGVLDDGVAGAARRGAGTTPLARLVGRSLASRQRSPSPVPPFARAREEVASPPHTVAPAGIAPVSAVGTDVSVSLDSARIQNLQAEIQARRAEIGNLKAEARDLKEQVGAAEAQIAGIRHTLPDTVRDIARPSWLGIGLLFLGLVFTVSAGVLALLGP